MIGALVWSRARFAPEVHAVFMAGLGAYCAWRVIEGDHPLLPVFLIAYAVYIVVIDHPRMKRKIRGDGGTSVTPTA
jgi:hypothetical protein